MMKNTMNRTREDVRNYIRVACGQYMANRICRMMDCFNTVEAFINADKGGLAFAFRKAYPKFVMTLAQNSSTRIIWYAFTAPEATESSTRSQSCHHSQHALYFRLRR